MKKIGFGIVVVLAIAAAVFLIVTNWRNDDAHQISVPSPAVDSGGGINHDGVTRIEVTPETLKVSLGTLARAESFSRTYAIKTFWNGGESESDLSYWQKGANIRLSITNSGTVRHILVRGDDLYVWYDGYSGVFKSKLSESNVSKEVDMFSGLLTYEELMDVPQEDIQDAGYADRSGQPCIYAVYKSGELGYVSHIYISIDTGLLLSTEKYDGDTLVYSMSSVSPDLSTPPDSVFEIPS